MIERNTDTVDVENGVGNMENNIDVIISLGNYLINQYNNLEKFAETIKDDPDKQDEWNQAHGGLWAWYYAIQALAYYVEQFVGLEEADD